MPAHPSPLSVEERKARKRERDSDRRRANPERAREKDRRWRAANLERARANGRLKAARRRARDPEKADQYRSAYYRAHKDELTAKAKQKYQVNIEVERERFRRYNAENRIMRWASNQAKRGVPADEGTVEYAKSLSQDPCSYCGSRDQPSIDHIVAVKCGGQTTIDNITSCCRRCNRRKQNNSVFTFLSYCSLPILAVRRKQTLLE